MSVDLSPRAAGQARPAVDPIDFYGVRTIPQALTRAATTGRDVIVINGRLGETRLPYAELDLRARRAAAELVARGVRPGARVGLLSSTSADLLVVLFGTWYAGAVPVLLPAPRRQADLVAAVPDLESRLDRVDARLLAVADDHLATFLEVAGGGRAVCPLSAIARTSSPVHPGPLPDDPDALAFLQFTSGTTKLSRAVMLTHRHLLSNTAAIWATFGVGPEDVGMTWLPLNHDMGLIGLLGTVAMGNQVVVEAPEEFMANPMSWLAAISRYRVSLTAAPNFAYALVGRLLNRTSRRDLDLSCLKWATNGAEPIDVDSLTAFVDAARRYGMNPRVLCPVYGLAEATLCVTMPEPDSELAVHWVDRDQLERNRRAVAVIPNSPGARRLVSCGTPIPGTEVTIRDEQGRVLAPGHVGEICVSGPCVTPGYWDDRAGTDTILRDGWLHTGDLGYFAPDGLVICGRAKDMIIVNGRNIYPEDFEAEAETVNRVRSGNTVAFAVPGTERMIIVVEGQVAPGNAPALAREVFEHLRRTMPTAPHEVVVCRASSIPKTSSGKRQRGRCRDLYLGGELAVLGRAGRAAA